MLRPDEVQVGTEENGRRVTLTFRADSGEIQAVSLTREQVPSFVARLVQEIGAGSAVPIDRGSMRTGQTYVVQTFHVLKPRDPNDGGRLLVLTAHLPDQDRVVTLPLELSPGDAKSLAGDLA